MYASYDTINTYNFNIPVKTNLNKKELSKTKRFQEKKLSKIYQSNIHSSSWLFKNMNLMLNNQIALDIH
jgi:hypothetical protein